MAQTQWSEDRWAQFQEILRSTVSPTNWQAWFSRLSAETAGSTVTLVAPNDFHLRWIRDKHESAIEHAFTIAYGTDFELIYTSDDGTAVLDGGEDHGVNGSSNGGPPGAQLQMIDTPPIGSDQHNARLVAKYRFESFVVGPSNRFAYAAAQAVAEQPGTNYNPLFIYGGAGLGKTHLLNAIGHQAMEMYPGLGVRYVTSETFLTEFIDGIRRKRTDEFKNRYRSTDILLLDDVQFFEGKEQILEEFFHTFNSLYESGKQLVISSDRHPRHLSTLEDRLRSRFEWGLLTDIQPPDVETRLAILKHNAEFSARAVPTEVLQFIASLVSDNIRELEGALTRVTAFAALTQQTIGLPMAERVLQDLLPGHESKAVDAPQIIRATAASYGFSVDDLEGSSRRQPLVLSRQVAMYLCRELTDLSLPKIGNLFGGRDHTTVMHAVEKIRRLMQTDREVFDRVSELTQNLRRTPV